MRYWLMKTEPDTFGVEDLAAATRATTAWDGVRNYQARNMLRDEMKRQDQASCIYSSTAVPGIVAIMEVVKEGYPDKSAFDRKDHHYDPDSDPAKPRWFMVDVRLKRRLARVDHAGGTAQTCREGTQGHGAAASGQSPVSDAGGGRSLEVRPLTRVNAVHILGA